MDAKSEKVLNKLEVPESLRPLARDAMKVKPAWNFDLKDSQALQPLLDASPQDRIRYTEEAMNLIAAIDPAGKNYLDSESDEYCIERAFRELIARLMLSHLPFTEEQLIQRLNLAAGRGAWSYLAMPHLLGAVERHVAAAGLSERLRAALERAGKQKLPGSTPDFKRLVARLNAIVSPGPAVPLKPGEAWSDAVIALAGNSQEPNRQEWIKLLALAGRTSGTSPSGKWMKSARQAIEAVGRDAFCARLQEWMKLASKGKLACVYGGPAEPSHESSLDIANAEVLKGLIWAAATLDDPALALPISEFAERCYKKLPYFGARCPKAGNACVTALSLMNGDEPAAQLSRLVHRVKQPSGKRATEKALARLSQRTGMSTDEIEERSAPNYGLDRDGQRADRLGEWTARIRLADGTDAAIDWTHDDGKTQRTVPAAVKTEHPAAVKELSALQKQLKVALAGQKSRFDDLFLRDRKWPIEQWQKFYIDHPVVATTARRLIWVIEGQPVLPEAGGIRDVQGKTIKTENDAIVQLWHPVERPTDEVLAWRRRIESLAITQPFKQAHREVYHLTDAERATGVYSNRFAAHVLRQHQLQSLCQSRGWNYRLQGNFDSGGVIPTRELPNIGLSAEFWVDGIVDNDGPVFLHVSTDQLRFKRGHDDVPLEQIPPLVLSEIMRDVDLFVGVASVGNDPNWSDGGPDGRYQTYWQNYSFGALTETANTRRDVLQSLLPRLTKIRDRCKLVDRFLVVRGELRTYKIHLGSGNILMEPNDQYLCIVPDRKSSGHKDGVFLPFEGDATLSIILSKAFLLADDLKIKDPTITRQIKPD